ncbi:hypothetical protein BC828DRAFT_174995 [Blastocladiella britannica]|nr:hypothetical protein BC828DRAFT_174995 [Blastocladiella britannica]
MMVSIVLRGGPFLYVPYYLRSISVLPRIRRFMHLRTEISYGAIPQDILQQRLVILIATLLTIIYVQMCSVQYAEAMSKEQYLTLMDSLYFTVVTLTTVGYGDISAASVAGRIIVMLGIIFAFIAIPPLVSSALDTYRTRREGGGSYKERNSIPHVVVMGRFDNLSLVHALLTAFFNNESAIPVKVVMLSRHNPSIDVKAMINAPKYSNTVFYIRGSALNEEDLCRAKVRTSLGVFFISDNTWTEDERNVLRVWSVARHAPSVELYVYTHRPAFQRYHTHHATAVVCADDLKQALVASNCLHPGISTLVANLITNSEPLELYHKPWHAQYGDGMGHEIYNLQIVPVFVGKRFHHICAYLFREFQVISIAVRIPVVHHDLDYETLDFHVVLNPAESYVFCGNEEIVCIAQGIRDLTRIQKLTQETFTRSLQNRDPIFSVYPDYQSFPSRPLEHIRALGIDWANPPPAYAIPPVSIPGGRPDGPMRIGFPEAPFSADSKKVPLCHLLVNPPSSAMDCEVYDATGSSGGTELTDHYVIITPSWMFFRLLCTLRSSHLPAKDLKPILFFAKDIPHSDAFHYSRSFPLVYFMRGNPRHRRDLIRANLAAAARIVILAPEPSLDPSPAMTGGAEPTAVPVPDNPGDEDFTDLDPILNRHQAVHLVARHGRDPVYTMVVLNDAAAIRFLGVSSQGAAATAMRAAAAAVSATVVTSDSTFRAESRPIYPSAYAAAPPADSVPNVIYSQYEPAAYVQAPPPRPLAPPPPATAAAAASAEVRHPRSTSPMPHGSRSSSPPFMSGTGTNGSSAADRARRLASPNLLASHAAASQRGGPAPPPPTIVNTAPTLERPMPRGRNVRPLSSVGVKYPTDPQPTALQPAMGRSISAQSLLHNPARSESEPMPHSTSGSAGGGTTDPMLVSSTSGGASVFGDAAADRSEAVHPPVPEYSGGHGHGSIGGTSFLAADPAALGGALHIPLQSSIGSISEGTMPRRRRVRRRRQETVITAGGESPGSGLLSPAGPMPVLPAGAAVAAAAGLVSPISPGASGGGDLPTDRVAGLMSEEENLGLQIGFPPPPKRVQMLYDPLFASGEAFCADSLDTILIQHFFNPTILDVVRLFSGVRSRTDISLDKQLNVLPSYFYTEPVPKAFVGKTFQSLFTHFILTRGIVSIGLYRGPSTDLQNSHSFVYTAPHPDVTLKANDSVYILTRLWRPERYPMGGADSDSEEPSGFAGGGGSGHASQRQQQQQQQQDPPVGVSPVLSHGGDTLAM